MVYKIPTTKVLPGLHRRQVVTSRRAQIQYYCALFDKEIPDTVVINGFADDHSIRKPQSRLQNY